MMRVYLAGSFSTRDELRQVRSEVIRLGKINVTSTWLDEPPLSAQTEYHSWELMARATCDLYDIDRSDVIVLLTFAPSTTGGMFVELGYALARDKHIIVVGALPGAYPHLPNIVTVESVDALKKLLAALSRTYP